MHFLRKYPNLNAARALSDAELRCDLAGINRVIDAHAGQPLGYQLGVQRGWIAQALDMRLWGIDSPR